MARPREFDEEAVLEIVIEIFWTKGFTGASFANLEKATGLRKASLFAAYGDKESLFCRALERYHREKCAELSRLCSDGRTPGQTLRELLLGAVPAKGHGRRELRGCFIVNTLTGAGPENPECARLLALHLRKTAAMLEELIKRGIRSGEFRRALEPREAARYIMCVMSGMQVVSRSGLSAAVVKRSAREQLVKLVMAALR